MKIKVIDAEDLLVNWARGEWYGEPVGPVQPNRCASAEGNYRPERIAFNSDESDFYYVPIHWEHHKIVSNWIETQSPPVRTVLIHEYCRRRTYYRGMKFRERINAIAKAMKLQSQDINRILKHAKGRLEVYFYSEIE